MPAREVLFFEKAGRGCTDQVVKAVAHYVEKERPGHVLVASVTGQTALKVARALRASKTHVICVTVSPHAAATYGPQQLLTPGRRRELEKLGVPILHAVPSTFGETLDYSLARYGYRPPSWVVAMTLWAVGGYGLKTAVEIILTATDAATIPRFTEVVSVAGCGRGADTAIVARSPFAARFFSENRDWRFEIKEILAMPRNKLWYRHTIAEWEVGI